MRKAQIYIKKHEKTLKYKKSGGRGGGPPTVGIFTPPQLGDQIPQWWWYLPPSLWW